MPTLFNVVNNIVQHYYTAGSAVSVYINVYVNRAVRTPVISPPAPASAVKTPAPARKF